MNVDELGALAYSAYGATTQYKNYRGEPMPSWDALPPQIRLAWANAAQAIWGRIMGTELPASSVIVPPPAPLPQECKHCGFMWPQGKYFARCPGCQQIYDGG